MGSTGLRFAMITTFYPPYHFGGDAYYVRNLVRALVKRGHHVEIIHDIDAFRLLSNGSEPGPADEIQGVKVHGLESRYPHLACLATQQSGRPLVHGRKIRSILEQGDFDVIHYHNASLVGGPGILAYGKGLKIYTAHEHWLVCPTHVLWRHNRELCTGRQCLRCVFNYHRPPQFWRATGLLQRMSKHVDVFCSPSRFSASKHEEFGFHRAMRVLPSFLPDAEVSPAGEPATGHADQTRPYFLFAGRLEKIKGVQDVIPVFDDHAPAELWIAGAGGYETELKRLAEGNMRVRFLGCLSPDELTSLYAGAIGVVTPSICYEVFPMVVLEAFREGTPIIARRLGPYPEIVEQSGAGMLFETREQLAEAIHLLANDSARRKELGIAARRALESFWSESVALQTYFDVIRDAAEKRQNARVLEYFTMHECA